jgi:hypothetical protein
MINARKDGVPKYQTNMLVKEKIDKILMTNAKIQANLGTDSTPEEREEAKIKCDELFKSIRELDYEFYMRIVPHVYVPVALVEGMLNSKRLSDVDRNELQYLISNHASV